MSFAVEVHRVLDHDVLAVRVVRAEDVHVGIVDRLGLVDRLLDEVVGVLRRAVLERAAAVGVGEDHVVEQQHVALADERLLVGHGGRERGAGLDLDVRIAHDHLVETVGEQAVGAPLAPADRDADAGAEHELAVEEVVVLVDLRVEEEPVPAAKLDPSLEAGDFGVAVVAVAAAALVEIVVADEESGFDILESEREQGADLGVIPFHRVGVEVVAVVLQGVVAVGVPLLAELVAHGVLVVARHGLGVEDRHDLLAAEMLLLVLRQVVVGARVDPLRQDLRAGAPLVVVRVLAGPSGIVVGVEADDAAARQAAPAQDEAEIHLLLAFVRPRAAAVEEQHAVAFGAVEQGDQGVGAALEVVLARPEPRREQGVVERVDLVRHRDRLGGFGGLWRGGGLGSNCGFGGRRGGLGRLGGFRDGGRSPLGRRRRRRLRKRAE